MRCAKAWLSNLPSVEYKTHVISLKRCCGQYFYLRFHLSSSGFKASRIPGRAVRVSRVCPLRNVLFVAWGHEGCLRCPGRPCPKPVHGLKKPALMSGAFGLTVQQMVLHKPSSAFSRVANIGLCPQIAEFLPYLALAAHLILCFILRCAFPANLLAGTSWFWLGWKRK